MLEHNRLDLLSLALLTARAAQLVEDGPPAVRTAREAVGLGGCISSPGGSTTPAAVSAWRVASTRASPPFRCRGVDGTQLRAEALSSFARLSRRARFFDDAAAAWSCLLTLPGGPPAIRREASEALAVHHEHRRRDSLSARGFALQSLQLPLTASRREALRHRVARLDRKLADASLPPSAPLFWTRARGTSLRPGRHGRLGRDPSSRRTCRCRWRAWVVVLNGCRAIGAESAGRVRTLRRGGAL